MLFQKYSFKKIYKKTALPLVLLLVLFSTCIFISNVQLKRIKASTLDNNKRETVAKVESFSFPTKEQIPSTQVKGMDYPYGKVSNINEFWGTEGNYNIVYSDENKVYISILNQQLILQRTLEIAKDLPLVGNAIQDEAGNYYIVYGKYDTADMNTDTTAGTSIVMSIAKYNSDGAFVTKLTYTGYDTCPYEGIGWGTKEPFNFGNCDLLIDSSGDLVCRYGRVMYNGHQSSHALYVKADTMTKLNYAPPYSSHSLDQKVIETSDEGYLFADRSDGRGFVLFKVDKYNNDIWSIPRFIPFHFRNGYIYQTTYAELAGIAECSNGYAMAGVSEKTLSYDIAKNESFNESRNLFLQVFSKNFNSKSSNNPDVQLLTGETRTAKGTYISDKGTCENGAVDYGVLWLTNYTGTTYASNPKMLPIGNNQMLIMWEKKNYDINKYKQYIDSCYMVVNSAGDIIIPETTVEDQYLTEFGEPTYQDGYVYWTTSDGESMNFVVNRLTIGKTMPAKIHVTAISTDKDYIVARAGEKTQIKVNFYPENADNKLLTYVYDDESYAIDENGVITVKDIDIDYIRIISKDNEDVDLMLQIITANSVPTELKATQVESDYVDNQVKLTWKKSIISRHGYCIYRSSKEATGYEYIGDTDNLFYYDDDSLVAGKKYYYKVQAVNYYLDYNDQSQLSTSVMVYILDSPYDLGISKASSTSIELTWSKVANASGYEIYLYNKNNKKYELIKTYTNNSAFDYKKYGLKKGQTYSFKLRAYKTIGDKKYYSTFSNTVKIII